jgi:hypothetical protein
VLESLFIQAPEPMEQELTDFAPSILKYWGWSDAYRQSLIWREPGAFTHRTMHRFNKSIRRKPAGIDALEVGISELFTAFLPKPNLIVDDQPVSDWRYCEQAFAMSS